MKISIHDGVTEEIEKLVDDWFYQYEAPKGIQYDFKDSIFLLRKMAEL